MFSPISSTLMILLIPFILILISTPTSTSSNALLNQACSTTRTTNFTPKFCFEILQSQPKVASAKNLFDLSIAIVESGISRSTNTGAYIESLLKKSHPNLKGAMQSCKSAYDGVIGSLNSALSEIKIKEYQTATYDLLIASTDNIQMCEKAVASKGIKDKIISRGNKIVPVFGLSAFEVVEDLSHQ